MRGAVQEGGGSKGEGASQGASWGGDEREAVSKRVRSDNNDLAALPFPLRGYSDDSRSGSNSSSGSGSGSGEANNLNNRLRMTPVSNIFDQMTMRGNTSGGGHGNNSNNHSNNNNNNHNHSSNNNNNNNNNHNSYIDGPSRGIGTSSSGAGSAGGGNEKDGCGDDYNDEEDRALFLDPKKGMTFVTPRS